MDRRNFLKIFELSLLMGIKEDCLPENTGTNYIPANTKPSNHFNSNKEKKLEDTDLSVIGPYGFWAASQMKDIPSFSFRGSNWNKGNLSKWKKSAKTLLESRLNVPSFSDFIDLQLHNSYNYDGLRIEEISWQLPYGRRTQAIVLQPQNQKERLPGILAFHDHGGIKYFGKEKITKISDRQHEMMHQHKIEYYGGSAWANEIAKKGYVVLVHDAFPFSSRRVLTSDVPLNLRNGVHVDASEKPEDITAYNKWAAQQEDTMAKSLFSAGLTWPGIFYAEDKIALDVLCNREDVIPDKVGCGGLSGGGMRTVFMGGLDERIKCAVCVGFMTTWKDFLLYKSFTHTWMTFVPLLPNELDFPEILGLRVPLPTMVLNDSEDGLYTLAGMKDADKILQQVYQKAGASDKYKCSFYPGIHKFDIPMQKEAFAWFDKWLKK